MSGVQANLLLAGVQNASPWPTMDELQAPQKLAMTQQRNALLNRMDEQTLQNNQIEYAARASAGLLSLNDEAAMAKAYPDVVAEGRKYGYLMNAPAEFPGVDRLKQIAAMGTPSKELLTLAENRRIGQALLGGGGTTPAAPAATAGTAPASGTYEGAIGGHEGTGQNPRSTAYGTGQFLESTWLNFAAEHPEMFPNMSQQQILAARSNPALGNTAINWLAQKNAADLQASGVAPSGQSLGIAHYLGSGAAAKIMQAGDAEPVRNFVSAAAVQANPELANMTVGQMKARYAGTPNPSFMTASTTTPGGQRVQVASVTPTSMTDGTTAPPGATLAAPAQPAATTTAQGAAPAQQPPAATTVAVPGLLQLDARGLTANDRQELGALVQSGQLAPTNLAAAIQQRSTANFEHNNAAITQARAARTEERQTATAAQTAANEAERLQIARQAEQRAQAKAEQDAKAAGRPLQGNDVDAQHENTILELADKMRRGETLTKAEQDQYDGAYYALQQRGGQTGTMSGPGGSTIPFQTTRKLPPAWPAPSGGALPAIITQPDAAKQEQATAEQSKAAGFADRIRNTLPVIADTSPAAMSRWQKALGQVPLGNSLVSEEFQQHMQSERDFINAVLRRESGAAISPSEFENARQQYIPQPGDGEKVLAQKARNRESVLNSLIREAGPTYKPSEPSGSTAAPTSAPPASALKEGIVTSFSNGQSWTLQGSKPVRVN